MPPTGGSILLKGTASASAGITGIQYQLNNNDVQIATGTTNWQATLPLAPGTNGVTVWAVNLSGSSIGALRHFFRSVTNGLILRTNGFGKITANFKGTNLLQGVNYTVTATPNPNNLFSNWTGGTNLPSGVLGTSNALTFSMQPNLALQANFITNVFLAAQGAYNGLFAVMSQPRAQSNSGAFNFNLTSSGALSGKLLQGSNTLTLSGTFGVSGAAQLSSPRAHAIALSTALQLDFTGRSVSGTVSDGSFTAQLYGDRKPAATPLAGAYTMIIPGTNNPANGPLGTSAGTVKIDAAGNLTFAGSLADNTAVSQSTAVSKDGFWPFYVLLYGGNGSIWGWNLLTNHAITTQGISWINPTNKTATAVNRSGFTNQSVTMIGASYVPTNVPLLKLTNGLVTLTGGGLPAAVTIHINFGANNAITVTNIMEKTNKLTLTVNKTTGQITGSFLRGGKTIPITGVLLQSSTNDSVYFTNTNQIGDFQLTPK